MKKVITIALLAFASSSFANPPGSGENNGHGCLESCGHHQDGSSGGSGGAGGQGGNGGQGGSSKAYGGIGVGIAGASAGAVAGASGGSSSANGSQSIGGDSYRSLSLSGGSVGSPANDTCATNASLVFGLATFPVTMPSCIALSEAAFLLKMNLREAAVSRLCQLESIQLTGICPPVPTEAAR